MVLEVIIHPVNAKHPLYGGHKGPPPPARPLTSLPGIILL